MAEQLPLRELYQKHQGKLSDKWSLYLREWDRILYSYRELPIRLLEIGIQNGGSLEIWAKYFPRAEKIVGCDIDEACGKLHYEDGRIAIVVEDANSDEGERQILQLAESFDVIIDDGSHRSDDVIRSFFRYFPVLKEDGIYLVEDLHTSYWQDYKGGLNDPLSSMAFFKRLADIINFEHWRVNKSRTSFLASFASSLGVELNEFDFAWLHSIEFVNSCCIITKSSPDKNLLGKRIVTGLDEQVTSVAKKLNGTAIQDITVAISDDTNLDVFELIKSVDSLKKESFSQEQRSQTLREQIVELEQRASEIGNQKIKLERELKSFKELTKQNEKILRQETESLQDHMTEREQILQNLNSILLEIYSSTAWKIVKLLWKIRLLVAPKGSRSEELGRRIVGALRQRPAPSGSGTAGGTGGNQSTITNNGSYKKVYESMLSVAKNNVVDDYIALSDEDFPSDEALIKLIAFYLPQYHPIPENDQWWGKGFTEWTNVSKAVPQFEGHYQPHLPGELGFYDLRTKEVQRRQVELAKKYGLYGFCFYYYWFNGKRLLDQPLNQYINDSEIDFPYCLCWANENWTRRWDGRSGEVLIGQEHSFENDKKIIHDFVKHFSDPRYIRINNRPLIIVYRADILEDVRATLDYWRKYSISYGTGMPYIIVAQTFGYCDPREDGFDGAVQFPPHNVLSVPEITKNLKLYNRDFAGQIYSYSEFVDSMIKRPNEEQYMHFKTVIPCWDNEPRRPGNGLTLAGSSPELYGKWLESVCQHTLSNFAPGERFVFINAWNEWGEGAHLEPDRRFGYAYLQATANALKRVSDGQSATLYSWRNRSINFITNWFNKIVESWPRYIDFHGTVSDNNQAALLNELSVIIDNLLLSKTVETSTKPQVSIIISVYNHFDDTLNCIKSLIGTNEKTAYEIIVIDDGSVDETQDVLSKCERIRYFRNKENSGFLNSCNTAAQHAMGDYIVLLNNDTIVTPGWLDNLLGTFAQYPNAGLVGSKLVYPNGRLQEAGGVIWEDASGMNFGRNDDPDKPEYNFLRETDYCSGASICIPKTIWDELQGLDELYSPAYYEDTDLAFRIRSRGYAVLYQPFSLVIHVEGATSGTSITTGIKQYQDINKQKFYERWKNLLIDHGNASQPAILYRNRTRKNHVLVIDVCTPKPDHDSGSIDTYQYLLMLRKIGYEVTFISVVDADLVDHYVTDLQIRGIECIYTPYLESIDEHIKQMGKYYDIVMLFRAPYGGQYIDVVKEYAPQAKVVFNTVDLHFLREKRERELAGVGKDTVKDWIESDEINIMKKADVSIVVSEFEQKFLALANLGVNPKVIAIPREIPGRTKGFEGRKNILFIGGYVHKPNVDAVLYFVREIWPIVAESLRDCEFWIAGSNVPAELEELAGARIKVIGYVADLTQIFSECKISVAPLRYGAGVKGKVITSLSYGVPCVATSIASEGMGLTHGQNVMVGDTPAEFAAAVVKLYTDSDYWEKLSQSGLAIVQENYSLENFEENLIKLTRDLEYENPKSPN